ncbi:MAG: hypothetical protein QW758_00275 [Candidatus Aenigmatarchaeota archaeon]
MSIIELNPIKIRIASLKNYKVRRKGDIEFIQSYLYVIIALVIGGLMIFFLLRYYPLDSKASIRSNIAKELARHALECWRENRYGMEASANVCKLLRIENLTTEKEITKYLDCEKLPNNICLFENCENCTSKAFLDNDKLDVFLDSTGEVKIAYEDRRIIISSTNCEALCICKRNCKGDAISYTRECIKENNMLECIEKAKELYENCINSCK